LEFYFEPGSKRDVDLILGIRSNGPVKFTELFEILNFFFKNEDNDYPQPWRRGRWMLVDAIKDFKNGMSQAEIGLNYKLPLIEINGEPTLKKAHLRLETFGDNGQPHGVSVYANCQISFGNLFDILELFFKVFDANLSRKNGEGSQVLVDAIECLAKKTSPEEVCAKYGLNGTKLDPTKLRLPPEAPNPKTPMQKSLFEF
jgi:hypothetical protein